jgi:hypothetical protein
MISSRSMQKKDYRIDYLLKTRATEAYSIRKKDADVTPFDTLLTDSKQH